MPLQGVAIREVGDLIRSGCIDCSCASKGYLNLNFSYFYMKLYLMTLKKHIPNLITLLNLLSGSIAVVFAVQGNMVMAALLVALGIFFDFFDGLAARMLDVRSDIGLQLDSLADMITSGLVPGIVMFQLLIQALPQEGRIGEWTSGMDYFSWEFPALALVGFLITMASGYRLAKFNIDDRQTDSFIGLPTPANALLILSLPLVLIFQPQGWVVGIILNEWFLIGLTLFSSYIQNAELPLFALKFSNWSLAENKFRYFFLIMCVVLLLVLKFIAIPLIIILYVLLSLIRNRSSATATS